MPPSIRLYKTVNWRINKFPDNLQKPNIAALYKGGYGFLKSSSPKHFFHCFSDFVKIRHLPRGFSVFSQIGGENLYHNENTRMRNKQLQNTNAIAPDKKTESKPNNNYPSFFRLFLFFAQNILA